MHYRILSFIKQPNGYSVQYTFDYGITLTTTFPFDCTKEQIENGIEQSYWINHPIKQRKMENIVTSLSKDVVVTKGVSNIDMSFNHSHDSKTCTICLHDKELAEFEKQNQAK